MTIGIYKFTNIINGHSYIGQSVNIEKRKKEHLRSAYNQNLPSYNYHFYQAIRKYGIENFSFQILETLDIIDKNEMNKLEIYYIDKYDAFKTGYNMTSGGDSSEQNLNSGERNSHAKLTEQDVINIRVQYNNHIPKQQVYEEYSSRINKTGFHKIWTWATWKNVATEYHTPENISWHSHNGKSLSSEQAALNAGKVNKDEIYQIRALANDGYSTEEIVKKLDLNISKEEVKKIINREKFKDF